MWPAISQLVTEFYPAFLGSAEFVPNEKASVAIRQLFTASYRDGP